MVDAQRSGEEFQVRRDDVTGPHTNDVAGDQFPGGNDLPLSLALDAGTDLQPFPKCLNDTGGSLLLVVFELREWTAPLTAITNAEIIAIHFLADSPPVDVRSVFASR